MATPNLLCMIVISVICLAKVQMAMSTGVVPMILQAPVSKTVPITKPEARFTCHAQASLVFWLIDGAVLGDVPNWIHSYPDVHDFFSPIPEVTREIGVRTSGHNNTEVICRATGSNGSTAVSNPAWLFVVDVPEPPSPHITILNSTAILVSWNKPYSHPAYDSLSYSLNIQDGVNSSMIVFTASQIDSYPVEYAYISSAGYHRECRNITMAVNASSAVGASRDGVAVGGFPIVPGEFSSPPDFEVTFSTELVPKVNITFMFPTICWYQTGTYSVQIIDHQTREEVTPLSQGSYHSSTSPTLIAVLFDTGLERKKFYTAIVIANTLAGSINTSATFSTRIILIGPDIPHLTILNSTAIEVQWNRSAKFEPHVAIVYTLLVRNDTTTSDILRKSFNFTADFNAYPISYVLSIEDMAFHECHNISFTIFAASSNGKEEIPASATSGFPIVPVEFSMKPVINVLLQLSGELVPKVDISFEYPNICWFQRGSYRVEITDVADDTVVEETGPTLYTYSESTLIQVTFVDLVRDKRYTATVFADTSTGSVNTTVMFSTYLMNPTIETVINIPVVIGATIGSFAALITFCCACVATTYILMIRKRKRKLRRQRRPAEPQVLNPLYESGGPIYDEIPAQLFMPIARQPKVSDLIPTEGIEDEQMKYYTDISGKEFTPPPGDDAYTLMNPAGTLMTASVGQSSRSINSKSSEDILHEDPISDRTYSAIRPNYSLPLDGTYTNERDTDTLEERYVLCTLLT